MRQVFEASVWREGNWYVAQALSVEVASQGESEEQALSNLREALELYFEPSPTVYQVYGNVTEGTLVIPLPEEEHYHPQLQEGPTHSESQIHRVEVDIATA